MTAHAITRKLVSAVEALPRERQEQLLELAKAWASAPTAEDRPRNSAARLDANGLLDRDYLGLARSEVRSPPDLATVRAKLARIPGSLTEDCIAERDERF